MLVPVIAHHPIVPVVRIFCVPKFGAIFVPAIAAVAETSAFTILASTIFPESTELGASFASVTFASRISTVTTLLGASAPVIVILLPPLKLALPVTSPHSVIVLAV